MNTHQAAAIIRRTLNTERGMRERVFRNDDQKRAAKVAEIDKALEALHVLAAAAGITQDEPPQPTLFDK